MAGTMPTVDAELDEFAMMAARVVVRLRWVQEDFRSWDRKFLGAWV